MEGTTMAVSQQQQQLPTATAAPEPTKDVVPVASASASTTTTTTTTAMTTPSSTSAGGKKRPAVDDADAAEQTPNGSAPATATAAATTTSNKKPKMTDEERKAKDKEKEDKRRERDLREKEKEERKREREAQKAEKDKKKRIRDEEKQKKDEEKKKKERSQPTLNMFFRMPKKDLSTSTAGARASTAASEPAGAEAGKSNDTSSASHDYRRAFVPFFVKTNMIMAPEVPFQRDAEAKLAVTKAIDAALGLPRGEAAADEMETDEAAPVRGVTVVEMAELLHIHPLKARARRGKTATFTTRDILARIENPDDPSLPPLTTAGQIGNEAYTSAYYLKLLNSLPHKFLKFPEVRPPYSGTYTKRPSTNGLRTGRKPFDRSLPGVNYDYDSADEWVADDEDGEDLLSEDEEDKDSDGGDSLDGFLDDEEDTEVKRARMAVLIATNSGMCWEDTAGRAARPDLEAMRIGFLMEGISAPVDPFSTKYWEPRPSTESKRGSASTAIGPPRKHFAALTRSFPAAAATVGGTQKRFVTPDSMEDFKRAIIDDSDMTKTGLVEVLKKKFPKIGKDCIKNTLDLVAERVGEKRDDKRWVLK